jgi:protein involved in polysaccharide export with SLBB domain
MVMIKVGKVVGRLCIVSCLFLMGLLLAGCQTNRGDAGFSEVPGMETVTPGVSASAATPSVAAKSGTAVNAEPSSEIIQLGNVLLITFSDLPPPPLPAFDQRVRDDGKITLIYNREFTAAGKRTGDLEREIRDFYVPKYFINMTPTVRISPETRSFYVTGEVRASGNYPYKGASITVSKAIATAGGFTDFANKRKVKLIRADGRKQTINCNEVIDHPERDPQVFPDDKIHVPRRLFW